MSSCKIIKTQNFYIGVGIDTNNWTIGFQRWTRNWPSSNNNLLAIVVLPLCFFIGLRPK